MHESVGEVLSTTAAARPASLMATPRHGPQVFRVEPSQVPAVMKILTTPAFERSVRKGEVQKLRVLTAKEAKALGFSSGSFLLQQDQVRTGSFPSEWTPRMLYEAGQLQLKLCRDLAKENLEFSSIAPSHMEFRGPRPVYAHFRPLKVRLPSNPYVEGFTDFLQGYLLPLLAERELDLSLNKIFSAHPRGLSLEEVCRAAPILKRLRRPFLQLATLPNLLQRFLPRREFRPQDGIDPRRADYFREKLFNHLEEALEQVAPRTKISQNPSLAYPEGQAELKRNFVFEILLQLRPNRVLDVGCSGGDYSITAAGAGAHVVALDTCTGSLEAFYRQAQLRLLDILPLQSSFLQRAGRDFDLVLALASRDRLVYPERASVRERLEHFRSITRNYLLFEYIGIKDLTWKNWGGVGITSAEVERILREMFTIELTLPLRGCDRAIYLLKVK